MQSGARAEYKGVCLFVTDLSTCSDEQQLDTCLFSAVIDRRTDTIRKGPENPTRT